MRAMQGLRYGYLHIYHYAILFFVSAMLPAVIIIHGARALSSHRPWLQRIIFGLYRHVFNFQPQYSTHSAWAEPLQAAGYRVVEMQWSGRVLPWDIPAAARQLAELLQQQPGPTVLLTESIGTEIALRALEATPKTYAQIIVALCPVHRQRQRLSAPLVSFVSSVDTFAQVANRLLWPWTSRGSRQCGTQITLPLRHDQFVPEQPVRHGDADKKLHQLVLDALTTPVF